VVYPYTKEVVAQGTYLSKTPHERQSHTSTVQEADVQDVDDAVAAANAAFPAWRDLGVEQRGTYLKKLSQLILESHTELAKLETLSIGRPISIYPDAAMASETFNYFATGGWSAQGTASLNTPEHLNLTVKQPYGVVGLIIPWNFPLAIFAGKMAPALAAGNTVVLKSSEKAPLTVCHLLAFFFGIPQTNQAQVPLCRQFDQESRLPSGCHQHYLRPRQSSRSSPSISHEGAMY
jgi:aldehyde dehydrogenase (NAD+)